MSARRLPPETIEQAQRVAARSSALMALGVGPACASQGGFATQEGAGPVRPPCPACAPIVAALPGPVRADGWKSIPSGAALRNRLALVQDVPGVAVCVGASGGSDRRTADVAA
jgi:hypothetical protein